MKHTKEQVIKIVSEFLTQTKQLNKNYSVTGAVFNKDDKPFKGNDTIVPTWTISVHDTTIFDTIDFYLVSDLTGDLLYTQSKHGITEIEKGTDGKFYWKS